MYGNSDFEKLSQELIDIESKGDVEIVDINKKLDILVSLDLEETSLAREQIIFLKKAFFSDLLALPSEKIAAILNHLESKMGELISDKKIDEFSREFMSGDRDKIPAIINELNLSLKTKFFRKIIHGSSWGTLLQAGEGDKIIAVFKDLNQESQKLLFAEIDFNTNRNFFDELLFIYISKPKELAKILNSTSRESRSALFTQKNREGKSFIDKLFDEFVIDSKKATEVLSDLDGDLKAMVLVERDENGHNAYESAINKICNKFKYQKHKIVLALQPLREIYQDVVQAMLESYPKLNLSDVVIDINALCEAFLAIDMLERIYRHIDGLAPNTSGNMELIYDALIRSETAQNPKYQEFLRAINAIKMGKVEEANVIILDANHLDHNAYFIVKCDADGCPVKISYIDAWVGIYGKNSSNYSFGEVEFDVDPSKALSVENIKKKALKVLLDKPYPSQKEMDEALSAVVKCDEKGVPLIVAKNIPTKIQKRNNCHLKSTLLLMRAVAEILDPSLESLVGQKKWSLEFEGAGFLEFDHKKISGKGSNLYKDFRNDFIDEKIAMLSRFADRKLELPVSLMVLDCLENARSKTEKKQAALMREFSKLGEFVDERQGALNDIYEKRLEILNKSIAKMSSCINPGTDSAKAICAKLGGVSQVEKRSL